MPAAARRVRPRDGRGGIRPDPPRGAGSRSRARAPMRRPATGRRRWPAGAAHPGRRPATGEGHPARHRAAVAVRPPTHAGGRHPAPRAVGPGRSVAGVSSSGVRRSPSDANASPVSTSVGRAVTTRYSAVLRGPDAGVPERRLADARHPGQQHHRRTAAFDRLEESVDRIQLVLPTDDRWHGRSGRAGLACQPRLAGHDDGQQHDEEPVHRVERGDGR